ncbi:MAG: GAF domain-containing protein [Chloroflexota bacterium]
MLEQNQFSISHRKTHLTAVRHISEDYESSQNKDLIFRTLLILLENLIPFDSAQLISLGSDFKLTPKAHHKSKHSNETKLWISSKENTLSNFPILEESLRKGALLISNIQYHNLSCPSEKSAYTGSCIIIPVQIGNLPFGFLVIKNNRPNAFEPEHLNIGQEFSPQIAAILYSEWLLETNKQLVEVLNIEKNARFEQLHQQYHRQLLFAKWKIDIKKSKELMEILQMVVNATVKLLPTSDASIILWDSKSETFHLSQTTVKEQKSLTAARRVRRVKGATHWIAKHKLPFQVSDIQNDPFGANNMLKRFGYKSYIGVPLIADDNCLGVLYALHRTPRFLTKIDINFLQSIANHVAGAIQIESQYTSLLKKVSDLEEKVSEQKQQLLESSKRIEQSEVVQVTILNELSHGMRTPLTAIKLHLHLLEHGLPDKRQHYMNVLKESSNNLHELFETLL